ncbi:hypothetical protein TSUD_421200, partial [Trifolium subterraneum]
GNRGYRNRANAFMNQEHDHPSSNKGNRNTGLRRVAMNVTILSSTAKPQVSSVFYISNFPEKLPYIELKKGLEVCGILEDLFVSRYKNVQGHSYGFVKFAKVKDIIKLQKALNNVVFWEQKLCANIAKYDRFVKEEKGKGEGGDWESEPQEKLVENLKVGVEGARDSVREKSNIKEGDDKMKWVPKVENKAIPENGHLVASVQQSLVDAGLINLKLIAMRGDKVLLTSCDKALLATFIQSTQGIIDNFLDDCIPWSQEMSQVYERGAWIRCYGVPLIAWNSIFFAELVESQGRLLLIDECTVSKQRMGFARILIVTTSMKEINVSVKVRINNIETNIRIIEDPGFGFAKDACLVEEEDDNDSQFSL